MQRRRNTKEQILDAALTLLLRQGFHATSISQIADAVGVRKASLYSHFASKQAILAEFVENLLARYKEHTLIAQQNWARPDLKQNLL